MKISLNSILFVIFLSSLNLISKIQYEVKYPSEWKKIDNNGALLFISKKQSENDNFKENVNVVIHELNKNLSLEEYCNLTMLQFKKLYSDSSIKSTRDVSFANQNAKEIIFIISKKGKNMNDSKLKLRQIITLYRNHAIVLTYTAELDSYDTFLIEANEILDSFRLIDTKD